MQSKGTGEMLCLRTRQCFGKHVSSHVLCWTIFEAERAILDDIMDKVVVDVDMFGTSMELVVLREGDGRLVVTVEGHYTIKGSENVA